MTDPASIAEQLEAAMHVAGLSKHELAARLSRGKNKASRESDRRYLYKLLDESDEGVERPRPATLHRIEDALGLPHGHFKVPPREPAAARRKRQEETSARLERVVLRLGLLEEQVRESTRDATVEIEHLHLRIERLERGDTGSGTNQGDAP